MSVVPETYELRPAAATAALATFALAPEVGDVVLTGDQLTQGSLAHLYAVELLAAQAGVVPFVELPNGVRGVVGVGAARDRIGDPARWHRRPSPAVEEAVRTLYLAAHGAVRSTTAAAQAVPAGSALSMPVGEIGTPFVVVVAVLGVAAIVAGAWFAQQAVEVRVKTAAQGVRSIAATDAIVKLAMAELQATGTISSAPYQALAATAQGEAAHAPSLGAYLLPALAVLGAAGAGWYIWRELRERRALARYGGGPAYA